MASALPKLFTRSSATRIVSAFQLHNPYAPTFLEPLASRPSSLVGINSEFHQPSSPSPGKEHPDLSTIILPSFPFGFPVNPVSSNVCCLPESVDDEEMDNSRTMWADSVKKKRKKKMNKHKYQKLRKRMRRHN